MVLYSTYMYSPATNTKIIAKNKIISNLSKLHVHVHVILNDDNIETITKLK